MQEESKSIQVIEPPAAAVPSVQPVNLNPKAARAAVKAMTEVRQILDAYVKANLVEGVDYGPAYPGASKNTLLKPGSEKMAQLFNLRAEFYRDDLCREMAGMPEKAYFFVCRLVDRAGNVWGEGRGACAEDLNRRRDTNSAIKIAEKRAQMDAVLRTFALSDRFTQDMEDGDYGDKTPAGSKAAAAPAAPPTQSPSPAAPASSLRPLGVPTEKQLSFLHTLLASYGMPDAEFKKSYGVDSTKSLTREQCSKAIDELKKRVDAGQKWAPAEASKTSQDTSKAPGAPNGHPDHSGANGASNQGKATPSTSKLDLITGFEKRIRAAGSGEISDLEGVIRLDKDLDPSVAKIALGFIETRRKELEFSADLDAIGSEEKVEAV